jgi:predicted DNA-binding protein
MTERFNDLQRRGRSRLGDALDVPDSANEFIQGAEKRANKHKRSATENSVSTSFRLDPETHKRLKMAAVIHETSQSSLLDQAINDYLDKLESKSRVVDTDDEDGI